jgi:hypothetical protein
VCHLCTELKNLEEEEKMLSRRNTIRNRVAKKFARVPGEHGDAFAPAFYPIAINPGWWGQPWGKIKATSHAIVGSIALVYIMYNTLEYGVFYRCRIGYHGRRAIVHSFCLPWADMDDPDYAIKYYELQKEIAGNMLEPRWGGTNFLASYLWQPGDPEPDIRRKEAPEHH